MELLKDKILTEGRVFPGQILKVDGFLNHQIDVALMDRIGEEFYAAYRDRGITRILTIESSGIAIACSVARSFGVPVLFAKKSPKTRISSTSAAMPVTMIPSCRLIRR